MNESYTQYWDRIAQTINDVQQFDELIAEQFKRVYLNLLDRWIKYDQNQRVLKTDLFAEAFCPSRAFILDTLQDIGDVVGIDISMEIACRAKLKASQQALTLLKYVNCDVRQLPFDDATFDLIISDSTLDHFRDKSDILIALTELSRVLNPGGTLIITMDNRGNIAEPLFRLWTHLGLSSIFLGKTYSIKELRQALAIIGLNVVDSTAIIHNPRFITWMGIKAIRKAVPHRFNHWIRRGLILLDKLERRNTKFLTGQFAAVKALKPGTIE
ncbi:MAG: class I SAM-dependent methyltransferase [Desulfobacteraceae bacterium]|nr:class I SAM-dependent methyltransferase [Desulfobacteraceae bacterium]